MFNEYYSAVCPYLKVPKTLISLVKLKDICVDRLKLYSILNSAKFNYQLYNIVWKQNIIQNIWSQGLSNFLALLTNCVCILPQNWNDCCNDDYIGHMFLALVSSRDHQLGEMFINFEVQWFQIRFEENINDDLIDDYLNFIEIHIEKVSLQELSFNNLFLEYNLTETTVYKAHFSQVPELFRDRKVLLKDGFLYFSKKYIIVYLSSHFIKSWKEKLKVLKCLKIDERIIDIVDDIFESLKELIYCSRDFEHIPLHVGNIDSYANNLFPICMLTLHKNMLKNSHLPHGARTQYAVFLKNAGMSYEDAMIYFQNGFSAKFDEESFRKKRYFYYFSYCFGRESSRIIHPPESCDNITNYILNVNDVHGCPFVHYDSKMLQACLEETTIQKTTVQRILEAAENKNYKEACNYYLYDKVGANFAITHPNNYYNKAVQHRGVQVIDIEDLFVDDY